MKLKDKIQILMDTDKLKEVKGTYVKYKLNGVELDLMVHLTESIWKDQGTVEVSEKTTGCRLFSMELPLKDIKEADVIKATSNFIKERGKSEVLKRLKEKALDKTE